MCMCGTKPAAQVRCPFNSILKMLLCAIKMHYRRALTQKIPSSYYPKNEAVIPRRAHLPIAGGGREHPVEHKLLAAAVVINLHPRRLVGVLPKHLWARAAALRVAAQGRVVAKRALAGGSCAGGGVAAARRCGLRGGGGARARTRRRAPLHATNLPGTGPEPFSPQRSQANRDLEALAAARPARSGRHVYLPSAATLGSTKAGYQALEGLRSSVDPLELLKASTGCSSAWEPRELLCSARRGLYKRTGVENQKAVHGGNVYYETERREAPFWRRQRLAARHATARHPLHAANPPCSRCTPCRPPNCCLQRAGSGPPRLFAVSLVYRGVAGPQTQPAPINAAQRERSRLQNVPQAQASFKAAGGGGQAWSASVGHRGKGGVRQVPPWCRDQSGGVATKRHGSGRALAAAASARNAGCLQAAPGRCPPHGRLRRPAAT